MLLNGSTFTIETSILVHLLLKVMNEDALQLAFDVVECSSEEKGHECSALETYRENEDGWVSKQNCQFPQVIVLKIRSHQSEARVIDRLEILCHELYIPQTVEISIGYGGTEGQSPSAFEDCATIQKLGVVTMESNKQSDYEDRKFKSISIRQEAHFIKLALRQCYENEYNMYKQVGIVGLKVLGVFDVDQEVKDIEVSPLLKSLPPHVKHELDPSIQHSVNRLEKLKKERAALEVCFTLVKHCCTYKVKF